MLSDDYRLNKPNETNETLVRQRSLRKVIPSQSMKENLINKNDDYFNEIYRLYNQEYSIFAEYKMLQTENLQGIYVIPARANPFVWFGVLFVRSGPYEDGIFRFKLLLGDNFPKSGHPKVIFHDKLIHPVIDPDTDELNLLEAFPTWNKGENRIWQVIKYIQWVFQNFNSALAHAVNKEASDMYKSNPAAFKERVQVYVKQSQEQVYSPTEETDKHYLCFERYTPEHHEKTRKEIFDTDNLTTVNNNMLGQSWVLPGTFKPLSHTDKHIDKDS